MFDSIVYLLHTQPYLFALYAAFIGLFIGSFLNVVILRLPVMMQHEWESQCRELLQQDIPERGKAFNLIVPRSHCPHCGHLIGALENIPLVSFLLQKGRCKHCNTSISIRYPAIELLTAVVTGIVAWKFGFTPQTLFALLLSWALISLAFIDIDHQLLPDDITLPLLWVGMGLSIFSIFTDMRSAIIGAIAGYLSLWLVYQLFKIVTGKEGMGFGDFKLLALLGAWFGWQMLPLIVLLSSLVGAVIGLSMILFMGRDRQIPLPFGPYLAIAGWIAMLWGNDINTAYLTFIIH